MHAFINAAAPWLNAHLKSFIRKHVPGVIFIDDLDEFPLGAPAVFQFCDGWELNRNFAVLNGAENGLINAYPNSDALARKDCLARVVEYWTAKLPRSILAKHVPETVRLTLDYSEYVEDALMAADDLSLLYSLEQNADRHPSYREWWILKPALVDCGAGIRLFSTIEELASHLELAANEMDDEDDEDQESKESETEVIKAPSCNSEDTGGDRPECLPTLSTPGLDSLDGLVTATGAFSLDESGPEQPQHTTTRAKKPQYVFKAGGRIPSAQMRAFVAQRYIVSIPTICGRKWHVRAYALAIGRLKVHVFRDVLALLAAEDYRPPWENPPLKASLTNTALQDEDEVVRNESMRDFWDAAAVADDLFPREDPHWKHHVFYQICGVAAELFRAAAHTMADKFTTLDRCFELFGLDFLVDTGGNAWLLEVNETPAFYQHGVAGTLALRLMESVVCVAMEHMGMARVGDPRNVVARNRFVEVLDETAKLGRSNITHILPE
ncbi:putative tubulin--tyrosine ligase PBY1 [Achaetomium macrosporum]|uniref:Tubulin--tyrosine ligase PBY1 n=1 Tax=Achaetomium macrosporum TaxID=79813 RepID=A0AAN7HG23_9PEZI|nr:putative tubulin--tyrosine ligase PBY1 [Achaetomium macrosporum]